jgi:hypothetical protein
MDGTRLADSEWHRRAQEAPGEAARPVVQQRKAPSLAQLVYGFRGAQILRVSVLVLSVVLRQEQAAALAL